MIELSTEDLSKILGESLLKIDSLETLAFLRDTPEEVAMICRVRFKDASSRPKDILDESWTQVQVLEQEKKGTYTILLKNKRPTLSRKANFVDNGMYLSTPYEISDERIKATFLGTAMQTRKLLQAFGQLEIRYKIVSLSDARFPHNSPLSRLTDKQRKVLITSYNLGYYDLPRRISSEELAEKLNIRSSTLVIHRIKAEKRLLDEILREQ